MRGGPGAAPHRRRGQRRRRGSGWAAPCPNGGENSGWGHCSGAGDNGNCCNVGARALDGGAGCRLHGRPGRRGRTGDVPSVAGRCSWHPSEHTLPTADLSPAELRSLVIRMGHALGRFQRERGMALPRPMAANSPLQSYFVDPEFAAVASDLFGERMPDQQSSGLRRP